MQHRPRLCPGPCPQAPSAEELKALEREHQRQVQADAERRKLRKQQEAEKKRQRALRVGAVARACVVFKRG